MALNTYRYKRLFKQDGFQGGVQGLPHILQEDGHPNSDAVLHCPQEVAVGQLDDLQAVLRLFVSDPAVGLRFKEGRKEMF